MNYQTVFLHSEKQYNCETTTGQKFRLTPDSKILEEERSRSLKKWLRRPLVFSWRILYFSRIQRKIWQNLDKLFVHPQPTVWWHYVGRSGPLSSKFFHSFVRSALCFPVFQCLWVPFCNICKNYCCQQSEICFVRPRSTQPPVGSNTDVGETQTRYESAATLNWLNQY